MKRQKDIFDLFRDNQHKLNEVPSKRTWRRLEKRLDAHQTRNRWSLYRSLAMAAGVLVLVAIVSLLSSLLEQKEPAYLASADNVPLQMEELSLTDGNREALKVVEFTRQYQDRMSDPIAEGTPNRKLVPKNQPASAGENSSSPESTLNINDLSWLVGQWKGYHGKYSSLEEWAFTDEKTLTGKGFLIKDQDTLFKEKITITQQEKEVILSTVLEEGKSPVNYSLKGSSKGLLVFQNTKLDFPKQIILRRDSEGHFSLVFQNSSPGNLSKKQLEHLSKRNQFREQQAVRSLERINK